MWIFNKEDSKWISNDDLLKKENFDFLKRELSSVRFYSKCLSGATFLPINNTNNIYDILGNYKARNWYIGINGSEYSNSLIPQVSATEVNEESYSDYEKYLLEEGLSLKTMFTPNRLIKDSINNFSYVDVATTGSISIGVIGDNFIIDGIKILEGHRVLVKDQTTTIVLPSTINPDEYFSGNYFLIENLGTTIEWGYYNEQNGVYEIKNKTLIRTSDLSDYKSAKRSSFVPRLGTVNKEKQFHLSRLLNGYYPTTSLNEPIEFKENKNWMLRNKVDYNNLFEINYYDVLKHNDSQYSLNGVTYSIPERIISVGEFGIIINNQGGISNIIKNKWKVNLRGISQTSTHYWICGDSSVLLKVRKSDFFIERIKLDMDNLYSISFRSVSFFNDLRGVVVGDLNTIWITSDGGINWNRLKIDEFDSFYFTKVIFKSANSFFISGNSGLFIEMVEDIYGWSALRRRISKFIDDDDDYLLVDNINDMYYGEVSTWGLSFSHSTQSISPNKELLFIVTDDSKVIVHDINDSNGQFDFLYLDLGTNYGDILNITRRLNTNKFYFTGIEMESGISGIFSFNLDDFKYIGVGNSFSNTILNDVDPKFESDLFPNEIYDFTGSEIIVAGNTSLLKSSTYEQSQVFNNQSVIVTSGYLYNWFSISDGLTSSVTGREPYGIVNNNQPDWVVPSDIHWNELFNYLSTNVGGKIKETSNWNSPNTGATNESGFSALPSGIVSNLGSTFSFGDGAFFHSTTNNGSTASYWFLSNNSPLFTQASATMSLGLSIRLVRPTTDLEDQLEDGTWVTDVYEGNNGVSYNGVKIGDQLWLSENLRETLNNNEYTIQQTNSTLNWTNSGIWGQPTFTTYYGTQNPPTFSLTASIYTPVTDSFSFSLLDDLFESRLKSKLMFLDYDAGSKMNFFTDFGEYRLPNSVTFSSIGLTGITSSIGLSQITKSAEFPSFMTQSETNWWTYWSDREMTFEYYTLSDYFTESTKVIMSPTFSYSATQSTVIFNISNSNTNMEYLAPSVYLGTSRYRGTASNPIVDPGLGVSDGVYIWDYLMMIKIGDDYKVSKGDVIRFSSSVVEGNFVVNKIVSGSSGKKLIYLYTEFNGNMITELTSVTASITNLNVYKTSPELESRFNLHPISNGWKLDYDPVNYWVKIDAQFNYFSSYYNLSTSVICNNESKNMVYTGGFLNFGYTPTYNILTYLEGLNEVGNPDPKFTGDKEYYSMPEYRAIPMNGVGSLQPNQCYIDVTGITYSSVNPPVSYSTTNKLLFGKDLKFEWSSIFINTYVDIYLYNDPNNNWPISNPTSISEKMLVMKKYFDADLDVYVIEFNKNINHVINAPQYWIDIVSRRKLKQISEDLSEMNGIQRPKKIKRELTISGNQLADGHNYTVYEREMNQKISTDSYLKILLSDVDTFESLTGIIYRDSKNELSFNVTKLEEDFQIPIKSTGNYSGQLYIFCSEKHGLKNNDGVVLEFNGGPLSSQSINQDYFGYHTVNVVNEFDFFINHPYGNIPLSIDTGVVKYTKLDPFLNFTPVDLIDIGVDGGGKQSIELNVDNLVLNGRVFSLQNIDFKKYRFRLIDGLNLEILSLNYPWILEAEISDATIGIDSSSQLIWYRGTWECGRWFGGRWVSGTWVSGDWYDGVWDSKDIKNNILNVEIYEKSGNFTNSKWFGGRWFGGTWNGGNWINGRWYGGDWNGGIWNAGLWNDGIWNAGEFRGGIWILGTWNGGIFNTNNGPSYWLDGNWNAGDFENGMWYNGYFTEKVGQSRFGVNSYNSRTSTWHGGNWLGGEFHSRLNINDLGEPDISNTHKYSIWYTGNWYDGDFYGGVVYNMDWRTGTWYGGILEDIEIIGFGSDGLGKNYLTMNGHFKFNTGDQFTVINNEFDTELSFMGSNDSPKTYTVLDTIEYTQSSSYWKSTKVYVATQIDSNIGSPTQPPFDTTLKAVSKFRNCNWKSGIWTNGIYEKGLWEGGLWYNGIFEATWM